MPERRQNKRERKRDSAKTNCKNILGKKNVLTVCNASHNYYCLVSWFGCVAAAKWGRKALHKSEGGLPGVFLPGFLDDCRLFGFFDLFT